MRSTIQSDLELGSNSIGSTDEHRIPESSLLEIERSSESSDDSVGSWTTSGLDGGLDSIDEGVSSVDGDSSGSVGESGGGGRGGSKGSAESEGEEKRAEPTEQEDATSEEKTSSPVSDVLSVGHSLEGNLLDSLVSSIDGSSKSGSEGGDGHDSSSVCNDLSVLGGGSSVESVDV